jgi:hypothetical protein
MLPLRGGFGGFARRILAQPLSQQATSKGASLSRLEFLQQYGKQATAARDYKYFLSPEAATVKPAAAPDHPMPSEPLDSWGDMARHWKFRGDVEWDQMLCHISAMYSFPATICHNAPRLLGGATADEECAAEIVVLGCRAESTMPLPLWEVSPRHPCFPCRPPSGLL